MGDKKEVMYNSSKEALIKLFVLLLTIGISVIASVFDYKACYATILVQACNNMYDFYPFTDNTKYKTMVKRGAIAVVVFSIISVILAIAALLEVTKIMKILWIKLIVVSFVTIPVLFVYNDYKKNVNKENEQEF